MNRMPFADLTARFGAADPFLQPTRPTVLVGIQRDVTSPFFFGGGRLQRMRVIVVAPEQTGNLVDLDADDAGEERMAEVLPALSAPLAPAQRSRLQPRLVQGEILRGEDGALYERLGQRVLPLRRLVSGPSGEILEVAESGAAHPFPRRRGLQNQPRDDSDEPDTPDIEVETEVNAAKPKKGRTPEAPRRNAPAFRPLFPAPGQWRVLRLGDFKAVLAPQLARPERLRDAHRLPCYVQVYEAIAPLRLEALAAGLDGEPPIAPRLLPLSQALALQLQLTPLLPPPAHTANPAHREPGLLLPGDRAVRLQLAVDPTAEQSAAAAQTAEAPGSAAAGPQPPPPPQQAPAPPTSATARALKTGIPETFIKPWEFRISREEALYDLSAAGSLLGAARRAVRRLFGFRGELRKWQMLLPGKNLEEQLWGVRPPRGGLHHPFIREWARRTLELAGYDSRTMFTEWEIYWRRKEV